MALGAAVVAFYRAPTKTFLRAATARDWRAIAISGLMRLGISVCFFYAITHAPRIESSVLMLSWTLFFVLFSVLFGRYRPTVRKAVLLAVSFAGVAIVVAGQADGSAQTDPKLFGLFMAILAAALGGLHSWAYKALFMDMEIADTLAGHVIVIFFRSVMGLAVMGLAVALMPELSLPSVTASDWVVLVPIGILAFAGTQALYSHSLLRLDEIELANIQNFTPVVVTVFLVIFIGDPVGILFLVGAGMIFGSQYAIQAEVRSNKNP